MPMSGPVYMHASIATPWLAVNHHTRELHSRTELQRGAANRIQLGWQSITTHGNYTQEQNFNLALRTGYNLAGWESTFAEAGIPAISTKIHAQTL